MGLLTGGTKALFGALLSPLYLDATLTRRVITHPAGRVRVTSAEVACKARVDSATTRMRDEPGYTDTDRAIFILAASLAGEVDTDAQLEVHEGDYAGEVFHIASIDRPPGCSYWLCRGTRKKTAPAGG